MPGRRENGAAARGEMLSSDSAHVHVEDWGVDALRRFGDWDGEGGVHGSTATRYQRDTSGKDAALRCYLPEARLSPGAFA